MEVGPARRVRVLAAVGLVAAVLLAALVGSPPDPAVDLAWRVDDVTGRSSSALPGEPLVPRWERRLTGARVGFLRGFLAASPVGPDHVRLGELVVDRRGRPTTRLVGREVVVAPDGRAAAVELGDLVLLDGPTGAVLDRAELGTEGRFAPVAWVDELVVGVADDRVVGVGRDGQVAWTGPVTGELTAVGDGWFASRELFGGDVGVVVDGRTGAVAPLPAEVAPNVPRELVVHDGVAYALVPSFTASALDGRVAWDVATGELRWRQPWPTTFEDRLAVADEVAVLDLVDEGPARVRWLARDDGAELATQLLGTAADAVPVVAAVGDATVAVWADGVELAASGIDGERWRTRLPDVDQLAVVGEVVVAARSTDIAIPGRVGGFPVAVTLLDVTDGRELGTTEVAAPPTGVPGAGHALLGALEGAVAVLRAERGAGTGGVEGLRWVAADTGEEPFPVPVLDRAAQRLTDRTTVVGTTGPPGAEAPVVLALDREGRPTLVTPTGRTPLVGPTVGVARGGAQLVGPVDRQRWVVLGDRLAGPVPAGTVLAALPVDGDPAPGALPRPSRDRERDPAVAGGGAGPSGVAHDPDALVVGRAVAVAPLGTALLAAVGRPDGSAVLGLLDPVTGEERWRSEVVLDATVATRPAPPDGPVVRHGGPGGPVLVADRFGVAAVAAGDGRTLWRAALPAPRVAAPSLASGALLVPTARGVVAIDAATGTTRWTALPDVQLTAATGAGDGLVVGTASGEVVVLDGEGVVRDRVQAGRGPVGDLLVTGDRVVAVLTEQLVGLGTDDGTVSERDEVDLP